MVREPVGRGTVVGGVALLGWARRRRRTTRGLRGKPVYSMI